MMIMKLKLLLSRAPRGINGMAKSVYRTLADLLNSRTFWTMAAVILNSTLFNIYLIQLFYGAWNILYTKAFYYSFTVLLLIYLYFDDLRERGEFFQIEFKKICKLSMIINFILIATTLTSILRNPAMYLFIFNTAVLITTDMILISALKHDLFKDK